MEPTQAEPNYKVTYSDTGLPFYFKDGKRVKKDDVPESVLTELHPKSDELKTPNRELCIFGEEDAESNRYVNAQRVPICMEHYHTKTIGEVAQQLRLVKEGADS